MTKTLKVGFILWSALCLSACALMLVLTLLSPDQAETNPAAGLSLVEVKGSLVPAWTRDGESGRVVTIFEFLSWVSILAIWAIGSLPILLLSLLANKRRSRGVLLEQVDPVLDPGDSN